jgi:hypothetical protein
MDSYGLARRLAIHAERQIVTRVGNGADVAEKKADASHGGFDSNIAMIAKTLQRITGAAELRLPVDDLVGF